MSPSNYGVMVVSLAAVTASLGIGAMRMRARLVPDWSGAPARLAEAVLALAALIVALEIVGVAGALRAWPAFGACLTVGLGMATLGRSRGRRSAAVGSRSALPLVIAAILIALLLLFDWARPTLTSLQRGMTNGDTLWYHMPFAARFVQDGSITGLDFTGGSYLTWFYPTNGELIHSLGILLAGHHDLLSPVISLAWLALALLAAWCVGRPFGAGAPCVAAFALLAGSRLIVEREPGAAHTDVAGVALLLAVAAILLNADGRSGLDRGAVAIAALAAGLSIGTKLTLLPPVGVMSIGVVALSNGKRRAVAKTWFGCLLATGGFWYARNLAYAGNPLPWVKLGVGPVVLASADSDVGGAPRSSVLHYATDPAVWRDCFVPGLHDAFGPLWPLLLSLAATGVVVAVIRGSGIQRLLGLAAIGGALAYVVNPLSAAGPEGAPTTFESNLRYLAPTLALGLVLFPMALPPRLRASSWTPAALVTALLLTGYPVDFGGSRIAGALCLAAIGAACALAVLLLSRGRRIVGGLIAAACVVVLVGVGWPIARNYDRDRYRGRTDSRLEALHLDAAYRWARKVRDSRIATTSILQYGLYGEDLTNEVRYLGIPGPSGTFTNPTTCRRWRAVLDAGDFQYLVLAPEYEGTTSPAPLAWVRSRNARPILRSGPTTVFRLSGPLDSSGCRQRGPASGSRRVALSRGARRPPGPRAIR